jgi:hypothetical protein
MTPADEQAQYIDHVAAKNHNPATCWVCRSEGSEGAVVALHGTLRRFLNKYAGGMSRADVLAGELVLKIHDPEGE